VLGLGLVGPTILVGLYVVVHGHQTPGGGFQGGVILATALLLVYLSDTYVTLRRVGPMALIELAEALGAGSLGVLGLAGLVWGNSYLENVLPLGTTGELLSAGTIPVGSVAVGLAVTGGFAFMLSEFLEQTLVVRRARRRGRS
jgi:multicomponent Na+:H+ antiporter subunit B